MMRLLGGPPISVVRRPDTRSASTGSRVPAARSISPRTAAHSSSSRDSRLGVGASRPLACVADGDRRADQLDLVRVLDRARRRQLVADVDPVEPGRKRDRQRAGVDRDPGAVEHVGQRSRGRADRIERADPEARVGHDLTARRHRSFGLVVADDEDRRPRRAENRDRWQRERARPRFDLGHMSGQPRHHRRMRDEERARTRRLGDRDRPLASRQHQNVTVSPPSTVTTCPVM